MLAADGLPRRRRQGVGCRLKLGGEKGEDGGGGFGNSLCPQPAVQRTAGERLGLLAGKTKVDGLRPEREGFSFNKEKDGGERPL